jgi:hypothetical protein
VNVKTVPTGSSRARSRGLAGLSCLLVALLGLLSRAYPLPGILAEYTGDALYAAAVFLAISAVFPRGQTAKVMAWALAVCVLIELSQLLSWECLRSIRSTRVGALILGQGFQWEDLLAYLVGVIVVSGVDRLAIARHV